MNTKFTYLLPVIVAPSLAALPALGGAHGSGGLMVLRLLG